jgi:hypothetical protein
MPVLFLPHAAVRRLPHAAVWRLPYGPVPRQPRIGYGLCAWRADPPRAVALR